MTRWSTQRGSPAGSANGVTPPIIIPVSSAVSSADANDARFTPSRRRTAPFTSSLVVASTTQATYTRGSLLPDDDDRVGRVVQRDAVALAERGGVGEVRIAVDRFVVDPEAVELEQDRTPSEDLDAFSAGYRTAAR